MWTVVLATVPFFSSNAKQPCVENNSPNPIVEQIYPSGDELPIDTLRFYIYFSSPMEKIDNFDFLKLTDEKGKNVDHAFLNTKYLLWSPDGKRLTVLFDPGRVKKGLKTNVERGLALRQGKNYYLTISNTVKDICGNRLQKKYRKLFKAIAPHKAKLNLTKLNVNKPNKGSIDELYLRFDRAIDHLSMAYQIRVINLKGEVIKGKISLADSEYTWIFSPKEVWRKGEYLIRIHHSLEDISGNTLGSLFNRPISKESQKPSKEEYYKMLSFEIK